MRQSRIQDGVRIALSAIASLFVLSPVVSGCNDERQSESVAAQAAFRVKTHGLIGLRGTVPKHFSFSGHLTPANDKDGDGYIDVPEPDGQECDTCSNGINSCGGPCGGGSSTNTTTCGGRGQCDCSYGGYNLVGYCGGRAGSEVCSFCPSGTHMADPCGTKCIADDATSSADSWVCPDHAPVDCNNGRCCPTETRICCPGSTMCGNSIDACASLSESASSGGSGSGSGGGGCAASCGAAGSTRSSLRSTGCCITGPCLDTCADGCGNAWYEASGRVFGPCSGADTSCLRSAATAAYSSCQQR